MCGIAGCLDFTAERDAPELAAIATAMSNVLAHRGPDDAGTWVDARSGVALGFRRLSIIDLSADGHQPMRSSSGRYVCVFNGEIYNYRDLRRELHAKGRAFRGHSDTEVLIEAFEEWGVDSALQRLNGMFALALWDQTRQELHLMRDRMGEKPLYYGRAGSSLLFASELKALLHHPDFSREVDRDALALYMRFNYIPAPYSIYKGIRKLPPASHLVVSATGSERISPYWSLADQAARGIAEPRPANEDVLLTELDRLLRDSVKIRMEADVPLGAMLSGGVDSSLVVAMMQREANAPVRTFTIGFTEEEYNEARHAAAVAKHLQTDHTELYLTPEETMQVVPLLPDMYDEPFADASQIPTFLVSRLARESVTVSLSGDGGDELFAGYNRYLLTPRIWRLLRWVPRNGRVQLSRLLSAMASPALGKASAALLGRSGHLDQGQPASRLHSLARVMGARDHEDMYVQLLSRWDRSVVPAAAELPTVFDRGQQWRELPLPVQRLMMLDSLSYLPDDILVKVDRATMAASLEGRMPLLDHRVVELAWRIPMSQKIEAGGGKWILRRLLHRYVPEELVERPKMGFGVPIDVWLRGPLREWAGDLLSPELIRSDGFLDPAPIAERWRQHLSGERDWQYQLWVVLMFQAWRHAAQKPTLART